MHDHPCAFDPGHDSATVDFVLVQCPDCRHNLIVVPLQIGLALPTSQHFRCSLCSSEFDREEQLAAVLMED
jgi:transposase-like protein